MTQSQRQASLAFAIEDQVARPLDEIRAVLGPELSPGRWLVAVTSRAPRPAPRGQRLLPDTLALPIPAPGHWSVFAMGARILVRRADGTGLVLPPQDLGLMHQLDGAPRITLYGGQIALEHQPAPLPPPDLPGRMDLSTSGGQAGLPRLARQLALVAGLTALGHLALILTDLALVTRAEAALETRLRAALAAPPQVPLNALLAQALAPAPAPGTSGFLPLLAQGFAALPPAEGDISLAELGFSAPDQLRLTFEAADIARLQEVEAALTAAGLAVHAGTATAGAGRARQDLTLTGGAP